EIIIRWNKAWLAVRCIGWLDDHTAFPKYRICGPNGVHGERSKRPQNIIEFIGTAERVRDGKLSNGEQDGKRIVIFMSTCEYSKLLQLSTILFPESRQFFARGPIIRLK